MVKGFLIKFIFPRILSGLPKAIVSIGTFLLTKELAPINDPKPIFVPGRIVDLVAITEKEQTNGPFSISLGGIGSFVKIV